MTVDGPCVVLSIRGRFDVKEAAELATALRTAMELASNHRVNFYTPPSEED